MENIEMTLDGEVLVLRVDLSKDQHCTTRNRSMRIASTEGNLPIWQDGRPHPKQIRVNLNVWRPLTWEEKKSVEKELKKQGYW